MPKPSSISVYYLEMFSIGELISKPWPDNALIVVREAVTPQWRFNRFLYQAVGRDWNWTDKADWTDLEWADYVENPGFKTLVAYREGSPAGYCELITIHGETELAYFGLLPEFVGRGLGGAFLSEILEIAWASTPALRRVWLHTCSRDHPAALQNYRSRGMRVFRTEKEPIL